MLCNLMLQNPFDFSSSKFQKHIDWQNLLIISVYQSNLQYLLHYIIFKKQRQMEIDNSDQEIWKCSRCTFINKYTILSCQICDTPKQFNSQDKAEDVVEQSCFFKQKQVKTINCTFCFRQNNIQNILCLFCDNQLQNFLNSSGKIKEEFKLKLQENLIKINQKICSCPNFPNLNSNHICEKCINLDKDKNFFLCPFCLISISANVMNNHLINCQKNCEIIQKEKKQNQKQLSLDKFKCIICEQIYIIDQCMILLDCNHNYCKYCIKKDICMKIFNGEVNQIKCKVCFQRVGYQTIKYFTDQKQFEKYIDLLHKNLKIQQDPNLIFRPCRGFITLSDQALPEAINQEKLQAFCNFYRNKPKQINRKIKPCQAIISYHKIQDKYYSTYRCIVCKLEMCVNGCNSIHRDISCGKYNKQGFIFDAFMNYFGLTKQMLDERGNRDYVKANIGGVRTINGEKYYIPHGFKQYGINLKGKYQNDEWLQKGPNAWVVMYHGVRNAHLDTLDGENGSKYPRMFSYLNSLNRGKKQKILTNILQEGLKPGYRQKFQGTYCVRTNLPIGVGIYGSPHINVCQGGYSYFSTSVQGLNYSVVVKCRVRPGAIRVCEKYSDLGRRQRQYQNDYWVIENPKDVRPYAFLLKRQ